MTKKTVVSLGYQRWSTAFNYLPDIDREKKQQKIFYKSLHFTTNYVSRTLENSMEPFRRYRREIFRRLLEELS